jgi:hypothetical protein
VLRADVENLFENMGCGLTPLQVRTAAFNFAASEGNNIDTPA